MTDFKENNNSLSCDDEVCEYHEMTLDEAIEHANEVANNEECEHCANEHKQLANWLSELKDIKSKYIYLAADFDNYKKRILRDQQSIHNKAYEDVIIHFLNVYDDLERVVNKLDEKLTPEQKMFEVYQVNPIYEGIKITFENFEKTLINLGCEKIECKIGDKFNVDVMDAMCVKEIEEKEKYEVDDVIEIYQSGWKYNGKVIRPIKVVVGK